MPSPLRLNQGSAVVFYLPHYIGLELGLFRKEGLEVEVVTSAYGQQWSVLERGEADVTIGGPMRTLWLHARQGKELTNFCAAVRTTPWYLVGRRAEPSFSLDRLVGKTVVEFSAAETPGLCFRWALQQAGIREQDVRRVTGLGTSAELAAFQTGQGDYLLHPLDTAAPLVDAGQGHLVLDLASLTGAIPWSTYAAQPALLKDRGEELIGFTRVIGTALRWLNEQPAADIATLSARYFEGYPRHVLEGIIQRYQELRIWPVSPVIERADFEHFCAMLVSTGWLPYVVPYGDQVDEAIAMKALDPAGRSQAH
jgi:NitT/TauT family transport system substrate-binding protein